MCESTFVSNSTNVCLEFYHIILQCRYTAGIQFSTDRSVVQTCTFETENIKVETKIAMVTSEKR